LQSIIIFVRHGESEGNKSDSFNGSLNLPLTERGKKQAEQTAEFLERYPIDAIYSSDLDRAYETATFTAKRKNIPIVKCRKLREIYGGDFEGIPYSEIEAKFPKEYHAWRHDMGNCRCPNGESIKELFERVKFKVCEIAKKHRGQTVLITTHATPIRAMSTAWLKKDITDIGSIPWVKNASVTIVDYSDIDHPEIILYDEHTHLKDLLTELPSYI